MKTRPIQPTPRRRPGGFLEVDLLVGLAILTLAVVPLEAMLRMALELASHTSPACTVRVMLPDATVIVTVPRISLSANGPSRNRTTSPVDAINKFAVRSSGADSAAQSARSRSAEPRSRGVGFSPPIRRRTPRVPLTERQRCERSAKSRETNM